MLEITSTQELLDVKREIGMLRREISLLDNKDFLEARFKQVEYLEFLSRKIGNDAILRVNLTQKNWSFIVVC